MKKFDPEPFESEMAELAPQSPQDVADVADAWSKSNRFATACTPSWELALPVSLVEVLMCCCCQEQLRPFLFLPQERFSQMCDKCHTRVMKSWRENLRQA